MNAYLAALVIYSLVLVTIGMIVSRRVKTSADFMVAGRTLGPGMLFATFIAANIGAGSTVGATGLGFRFGLSAWWWVGSASIGSLLLAQTLGPRLWTIAKERRLNTLGDYLEFRYNKAVKAVIAVLLWVGTLTLLAAQLIAVSTILHVSAGTSKVFGCLLGGIVAVAYCAAGGLMASAFVNAFELVVTMSGLLLAVPFALHHVGGWSHVAAEIASRPGKGWMLSLTGVGLKQVISYVVLLAPSFMISPGLVQKLYGARDAQTVRVGVTLNAGAQALFAFVPAILGLCVYVTYPRLAAPETALPFAIKELLPRWLGMWAMASIFSAELSATGAILFMLSTSLTVDLYKTFLNPKVTEGRLLTASRLASVLAGVAGIFVAIRLPTILSAIQIFYSLLSVSLFFPVLAGLYSRRMLANAALVSIVASVATTMIFKHLTASRGWGPLSPEAAGILVAAVVMLLFRFLDPASARAAASATRKKAA